MANSEAKTAQVTAAVERSPLEPFRGVKLGSFSLWVAARLQDLWGKRKGPEWQSYPLAALSEEERGWLAHVLGDLRLQFEIGPVAGGPIKADQLRVRVIARAIEQAAQRLAGMLHRDAAAIEPPWTKGNSELRIANSEGKATGDRLGARPTTAEHCSRAVARESAVTA